MGCSSTSGSSSCSTSCLLGDPDFYPRFLAFSLTLASASSLLLIALSTLAFLSAISSALAISAASSRAPVGLPTGRLIFGLGGEAASFYSSISWAIRAGAFIITFF